MTIPRGYKALPGSDRPQAAGSVEIGPVDGAEEVAFTVLLRPRPGSEEPPGFEHWMATPSRGREYLSADELARRFGAAEEELAAVRTFVEEHGMRVLEADAGHRRMVVAGPAAEIDRAFGIALKRYRVPRRYIPRPPTRSERRGREAGEEVHRGFEGPVALPSALAEIVTAVIGLDDRRLGGPAGVGAGDPPGANLMLPTAVAQLYDFPHSPATGQTIGLFADAAGGSAYYTPDITKFISDLPAGYQTQPTVQEVDVKVGLVTYSNDPTIITSGGATGATQETVQDIETSAATGQGATIAVYFTTDSEAGWEAFLYRVISPQAGDSPPSVISASWVLDLDDATAGNPGVSGTPAAVISGYLQRAALRGITALIAIGDWGSANQVVDGNCHVGFPNSDPWFTTCGGTIVGDIKPGKPTTFEEYAWSDANTASTFDLAPYDSTGGGVSAVFPVPAYQTAAGVLPISKNDGNSRRGVPDVAGMVAMTGFVLDDKGFWFVGTSCVAPLYAGLIATINAFLEHPMGFLNPTLYGEGTQICRDVTYGNNDPGVVPDPPFYVAGPEWDLCTGWGSINGRRLLAALAPAPILETAIAGQGNLGQACPGRFVQQTLTINNTGFAMLLISDIRSSSPHFQVPAISGYPLEIAPGTSLDLAIRFSPDGSGPASAQLTIYSNELLNPISLSPVFGDKFGPHTVSLSGTGSAPKLVLAIADHGDFGDVCVGALRDQPLLVANAGDCMLTIKDISSSSSTFATPEVLAYPLTVAPGTALPVPIRFAPSSLGAASATITVDTENPTGQATIEVSGEAPGGTIAVVGSACFGGVEACHPAEKTISVCNVGTCPLHVTSVGFKRPTDHWNLVDNPFPATLPSGSCLGVVVRYKADERCPRACELVIESDDPHTPVKTVDLLAYTIWCGCGCESKQCGCTKKRCECSDKPCCEEDRC